MCKEFRRIQEVIFEHDAPVKTSLGGGGGQTDLL